MPILSVAASPFLMWAALVLPTPHRPPPAPVRHVFLIMLENESFDRTFGPTSQAPYLARTLPPQGAFVRQYYGVGHNSLDNYVALVSGQAPNEATQKDCRDVR